MQEKRVVFNYKKRERELKQMFRSSEKLYKPLKQRCFLLDLILKLRGNKGRWMPYRVIN